MGRYADVSPGHANIYTYTYSGRLAASKPVGSPRCCYIVNVACVGGKTLEIVFELCDLTMYKMYNITISVGVVDKCDPACVATCSHP